MKLLISLLLLSHKLYSAPINLLFENRSSEAQIYRSILMREYSIPEELIGMKRIHSCEETKGSGKLDLCLKKNGDLIVVSVDHEFISESLKVFQAP